MIDEQLCKRDRGDCNPLSNIIYDSTSFCCVGCVDDDCRTIPQDKYRHCFKSELSDSMYDYDRYDMISVIRVLSDALLYDELEEL